MTTRRQFLTGTAAAIAAMGIPLSRARADTAPGDRKFVFVFNPGGWDPTRTLQPLFDNPNVAMEPGSERGTAGGIAFVDHPDRPSVRTFFDANHARTCVLNGLMVRSIAHDICTMIAMTGSSDGVSPDWPAVLAASERERYTLPNLVVDGPSFPGELGVAVARTGTNGQLAGLLSGRALQQSDRPVSGLSRPAESVVDRYLARRSAARADAATGPVDAALSADLRDSIAKATALKDLQYAMDFGAGAALADQLQVAVDALSLGVSRCVTIAHRGGGATGWDTHNNNDTGQSPLWEQLFQGLGELMALLDATPGTGGGSLADETLVIVLSELGRTPMLNPFAGKDHWPYTSAMLVGAGVTGDRVVGGFDDRYYGQTVDPASADVADAGEVLSAEALGATLLAMADIDPDPYVSGVEPLTGIVA
jgi:uncharacterized protein (DUF1501 family)